MSAAKGSTARVLRPCEAYTVEFDGSQTPCGEVGTPWEAPTGRTFNVCARHRGIFDLADNGRPSDGVRRSEDAVEPDEPCTCGHEHWLHAYSGGYCTDPGIGLNPCNCSLFVAAPDPWDGTYRNGVNE